MARSNTATRTQTTKAPKAKTPPAPVNNDAEGKTYSRTYKGTTYTVTESKDGKFNMGGKEFSSLTACAQHIMGAATKKDPATISISGPAFFGSQGNGGKRLNRNERNVKALIGMAEGYKGEPKIAAALKAAAEAIAKLPPPAPPAPRTVTVTLEDGRTIQIPSRYAKP